MRSAHNDARSSTVFCCKRLNLACDAQEEHGNLGSDREELGNEGAEGLRHEWQGGDGRRWRSQEWPPFGKRTDAEVQLIRTDS